MDVDAVVLDIDGVLIDPSDSYYRAIIDTLRATYEETIDRSEIQLFKNAGGFNNDWLVTDAIALYLLARREGYSPSIATYTDAIAEVGGGREGALQVLETALAPAEFQSVREAWDPEALRETFQWLYLGPDRYQAFEGDEPPAVRPTPAGFMDEEPILITDPTVQALSAGWPIGIHTGRPATEAAVALERIGLSVPSMHRVTMDDWNGGKPDPAGLQTLGRRLGADVIVYAGDELDDVRTAVNATGADPERTYLGIGIQSGGITGSEGKQQFLEVGATAVLPSINDLPDWIGKPE